MARVVLQTFILKFTYFIDSSWMKCLIVDRRSNNKCDYSAQFILYVLFVHHRQNTIWLTQIKNKFEWRKYDLFSVFILWLEKLALNSIREYGVLSPDATEMFFSFGIIHLSLVDCVYVCFPRFLHRSTARTRNRSKSLYSSRWQRCTYLLLTNMKIQRKLKKNT